MTDIPALATACTARIMDRIEMCRTERTAILSDDIKAEVERTLKAFMTSLTDELRTVGAKPNPPMPATITHYDDATAEFVYSDGRRVSMLQVMSKGGHAD